MPPPPRAQAPALPGAPAPTLGIRVRGSTALGGAWDRFQPCEGLVSQRCDGGSIPRIAQELRLGVEAAGTVLDRVHVAVDYDGTREFDAANDIRVRYEGRPGEWLHRLEAGNVQLRLPASRFLAPAVPAAQWGVRAASRTGPVEWQALWAQSGGQSVTREFRLPAGGGGAVRETAVAWDDAAYAGAQFFFLFDPARIRGAPHVDVLALADTDAPPGLVPAAGVRLYRYEGGAPAQDGSTTLLRAAPADASLGSEAVSAPFRLLQEGIDFQLHRSGLWVALKQPLRDEEVLGVAYRTRAGNEIGETEAPVGSIPAIRLLRGPRAAHRPGTSTWPLEMRQVYRVSGGDDVETASLRLVVSRGESVAGDLGRPHPRTGATIPYLQLFGLDEEQPREAPDRARLFRPADEVLQPVVGGVFLVFPTLRPFAEPPPLRSLGLSAAETAAALGEAANPALYEAWDHRDRAAAARFRLGFRYRSRGDPAASAVMLGAIGIREGSERVYLGSRLLQRGADYQIVYETGQLELLAPPSILGGGAGELRVTFEQLPLFASAPTRVAGLSATLPLGAGGEISVVGLSQQERSLLPRATLGTEPASLLVGGVAAHHRWGVPWLDRVMVGRGTRDRGREGIVRVPGAGAGAISAPRAPLPDGVVEVGGAAPLSFVRVSGEVAVSLPDPRFGGVAYLDDFEDRREIAVPLQRSAWMQGSAPATRERADGVLPAVLDPATAGPLVWQHEFRSAEGQRDGSLPLAAIDGRIRTVGNRLDPNVLYLSMNATRTGAWRSITTVLSPSGRDLRNHGYLEVYVRGATASDALIVDLGTVSEDAFVFDAEGRTGGVDAQGRAWGAGVLDREWDPTREAWTVARDGGLWNPACTGEREALFPLGDPRANCTRGNGLPDTEDLNGNGVLETDERVFRWVLRPAHSSDPFLAADTTETGTRFRLFRIPLDPAAAVGATRDDLRQVRHLRLTVVGGPGTELVLARMRLVGAGWERRGETGTVEGLAGRARPGSGFGGVEVGPVSRLVAGAAYLSPPGVSDLPADATAALSGAGAAEFNEQALRVRYRAVAGGERAEVYRRYDGGPQNFLAYRELRLWALARAGGWGRDGEELVVRVGSDAENHYLFRHRIHRVGTPAAPADWGPEVVIAFEPWLRLRAEAERLLADRPPGAHEPLVVWSADSTHAVVVSERGRAPNLAAVREISLGVWNPGPGSADGELWINDVRLAAPDSRPGLAGTVAAEVRAGEVVEAGITLTRRGGEFRDLSAAPTFQTDQGVGFHAGIHLGRLLPAEWNLEAPLHIGVERSAERPVYVHGTDLDAGLLPDLRPLGGSRTRVSLVLRRGGPSPRPWMRTTLDGVSLRLGYTQAADDTRFLAARQAETSAGLRYETRPDPRSVRIFPGGLTPLRWLPFPLGTPAATASGPRPALALRWTPVHLSFGSTWSTGSSLNRRFAAGLPDPATATGDPGLARGLVHHGSVGFRPLESLTGSLDVRSSSDLLVGARQNPAAGPSLDAERIRLGGLDLGREAQRDLTSRLAWNPRLASWLTMSASAATAFALDANPAYLGAPSENGAVVPLRSFGSRRTLALRWGVDPRALATAAGLAEGGTEGRVGGSGSLLSRVRRLEVGWENSLTSSFDRVDAAPDLAYQLGLAPRPASGAWGPTLLADRSSWTARASIDLPGAVELTVSASDVAGTEEGLRRSRAERVREWPGVQARWTGVPLPGLLGGAVRTASLAAGLLPQWRTLDDAASGQRRGSHAARIPLDLSLHSAHGLSVAYRGEWRVGGADIPGARTEQRGADHSVVLGGSIVATEWLGPAFDAPISVSVRYSLAEQRECRLTDVSVLCRVGDEFARNRARVWGLQLDTRASGTTFGLQLEHRDRLDRAWVANGHQQFSLRLFGQFALDAGLFP
jgi:hypothetical protein